MPTPKTYAVGSFNKVVRREGLPTQAPGAGPWIDISPPVDPNTIWRDVMASPFNSDFVVIVGQVLPKGSYTYKTGILVSNDAGATWQEPVGNWDTFGPLDSFYEVWVVDSQNIWVVGNRGWVVRSFDGGLSFIQPDPFNTISFPGQQDLEGSFCIHAIDANIAVVAASDDGTLASSFTSVWKTTTGGSSWTELNQSPYYTVPPPGYLRNAYAFPVNASNPAALALVSQGSGYTVGTNVPATSNGTGKNLLIDIDSIGPGGVITSWSISSGNGGNDFQLGEIVTVIQPGSSNNAQFLVNDVVQTSGVGQQNPVGSPNGIWMSEDENRIIVSTTYTQQISYDAGNSFETVGPESTRSGLHLTWFPSHDYPTRMRKTGGFPGQVCEIFETTDVGTNWTIERQFTGVAMRGAHFYSNQNGYYTSENEIFESQNGGVTGVLSYTGPTGLEWEAVWTQQSPTIYQLVDCTGQQPTQYATDPNLANYVDQVIIIPSFVIGDLQGGCFLVELYTGPQVGTFDQPVPVEDGPFPDCVTCDPTYYELVDCEGNEAPIYTTTDLSQYMPLGATAALNNKSLTPYLTLTPCCGGPIIQSAIIASTCTEYEVFLATDSQAGVIQYYDCDGNYQEYPFPFIDSSYGQGLTVNLCVNDAYPPINITSTGAIPTPLGDCTPIGIGVPNWLQDPNNVAEVVVYNGECYSTGGWLAPGPWATQQPVGFINPPTDAEVTLLNATDCVEAANENPACICTSTPPPAGVPGNVVQIEECPNVCWQINEIPPDATLELTEVTVTAEFQDCEDCLPSEPVPELIINNRKVKPGYDTPGCPPEYWEKVNCSFAEAFYREVVNKRYGVEICCDEDKDKWVIDKMLLDLKAIYDPEACKTLLPDACCPPCNVSAVLNIFETFACTPPLDVTSELEYPAPCLPPVDVDSELLVEEPPAARCRQYLISAPPNVGVVVEYVDCNGQPKVAKQFSNDTGFNKKLCALDIPAPIFTNCTGTEIGDCDNL